MNINDFLKSNKIDAFAIKDLNNIFYLTGEKVSFGIIILSADKKYFISDARYLERLYRLKDWQVLNIKGIKSLSDFIKSQNWKEIGIESDVWTIEDFDKFNQNLKNIKIKKIPQPLKYYRMIKTESEIKKIEKAIDIINKVYNKLKAKFDKGDYIGYSEKFVRKDIICNILELGGEGESFESIVAFGKNSNIPHRTSGNQILQNNMSVLIDMGSVYQGYCSDFTRSFWFGKNPDKQRVKIYDVVRRAFDKAWEMAIAGNLVKDVDLAARKVIEDAGYSKYFVHSTGHGIGIEVHEYPIVYHNCEEIIKPGMVFTIEPGIYIPGKFGVRWEKIKIIK